MIFIEKARVDTRQRWCSDVTDGGLALAEGVRIIDEERRYIYMGAVAPATNARRFWDTGVVFSASKETAHRGSFRPWKRTRIGILFSGYIFKFGIRKIFKDKA